MSMYEVECLPQTAATPNPAASAASNTHAARSNCILRYVTAELGPEADGLRSRQESQGPLAQHMSIKIPLLRACAGLALCKDFVHTDYSYLGHAMLMEGTRTFAVPTVTVKV